MKKVICMLLCVLTLSAAATVSVLAFGAQTEPKAPVSVTAKDVTMAYQGELSEDGKYHPDPVITVTFDDGSTYEGPASEYPGDCEITILTDSELILEGVYDCQIKIGDVIAHFNLTVDQVVRNHAIPVSVVANDVTMAYQGELSEDGKYHPDPVIIVTFDDRSTYEGSASEYPGDCEITILTDSELILEGVYYCQIKIGDVVAHFNLTIDQVVRDNPFTDVPEKSWYTEAALWCRSKGYITGTSKDKFSPNASLTRAMFVQMLAKVDGIDLNKITYSGKFKDVKSGEWFAKAVQWATDNGVTAGTSSSTFSPKTPVTREQLATFLFAYAKSKGLDVKPEASLDDYTDANTISFWAANAVKWAVAKDLISGTGNSSLSPKIEASRAQAALIIMKFVENVNNK